MLMPDVNVLVYAHRADETVHRAYKRWLTELVNGRQPFALSVLVAVGFVRVVTHPSIYPLATPLATALAVVDQMVAHPRCRLVVPSSEHWRQVADLCRLTRASGKLVADAQHAAIAIAEGCTWVTRDADFASFAPHGLRWQHLLLS
jgi:toxin-antitoxin system PIN domain toxin